MHHTADIHKFCVLVKNTSCCIAISNTLLVPLFHVQHALPCFNLIYTCSFCIGGFATGWRIKRREGECHLWRVKQREGGRHLRSNNHRVIPINTKRSMVAVFVMSKSVQYSSCDSKSVLYWPCDTPKCAILVMWSEKVCFYGKYRTSSTFNPPTQDTICT